MPATAENQSTADSAGSGHRFRHAPLRPSWGLRRLITSSTRIADLQIRIWLTQAKIAAVRVAIFAALFSLAAALAILSVVFLFIGIFRLLTDVAGIAPVWAYLIMGGFTLLVAGILLAVGMHMLSAHDKPDPEAKHDEHPSTQGAGA